MPSQNSEESLLCYTAGPSWLAIYFPPHFLHVIHFFLVMLGLCRRVWAFSSCEWTFVTASLVVECGLEGVWALVVTAHGLSCSTAHGRFPDQGLNPCTLHQQANSSPLNHQGSPAI